LCTQNTASQYIPLTHLGVEWKQYVPEDDWPNGLFALCRKCFGIVRRKDGVIMAYKTFGGKIKQHVDEELFGDPTI